MTTPIASPAVQPPPGNPRFELVDAMRAIAVLLVVGCHATQMSGAALTASWGWLGTYAYFGVILFFVISGFLLYRPFASAHAGERAAPGFAVYARRRALRILPAYWVALTLLSIWPGIVGAFTGDWWVYYGLLQVYSVDTLLGGLPTAWSLCVEATFYVALPLLATLVAGVVARRAARPWWQTEALMLGAFAAIGLVGQALVHDKTVPYWIANTLLGTSAWFVGGMALAVVSVAAQREGQARRFGAFVQRRAGLLWLLGVLVFLLGARVFDVRDLTAGRPGVYGVSRATWLANYMAFGVAAALLLAPAVFGATGVVRRVLAWRPLAWLGLVSYGVFLWHFPISAWLALRGAYPNLHGGGLDIAHQVDHPTIVLFVATLVLSTLAAAVSYYLVELPFLRLKEPGSLSRWRKVASVRD